jgi:hypothetical protein
MKRMFLQIFLGVWLSCYSQDFPGLSVISEKQIRSDLLQLTSQEFAGREAGLAGGISAGNFIIERLKQSGLTPFPGNEGSFFQQFQIVGVKADDIAIHLTMSNADSTFSLSKGLDFHYFFNTPDAFDFAGSMIFAGYTIEAPEYFYNDLANCQIKDRIVLAFYGEPLEKDTSIFFNGTHQTKYSMEYWKAKTVKEKGGKALILIPTPDNEESYKSFLQRRVREKSQLKFVLSEDLAVPVIYLSTDFAEKIRKFYFKQNFESMNSLLREKLKKKDSQILSWPGESEQEFPVTFAVKYDKEEIRNCRNIVTYLSASNKGISDECVLIGAHYDHEGIKEGKLFPGADDNASGVAANLQIATVFAKFAKNMNLQRNLVFAFWDAEEKGMLGTQYFVEHPLIPLEKIKVVFNMDMIGRDASFKFAALRQPIIDEGAANKVMLFYSAKAPTLRDLATEANHAINLHLLFDPNVFFTSGSDHVNFHSRKIPVIYYFTGFHTDYSSANDTADKIDFKKLTRITQHIANFSYRLVNAEKIPEFDSNILTAPEGDFIR